MSAEPLALPASELQLSTAWSNPGHRPLRLESGAPVRIVFPGVPAGGRGPDFQGAILEVDGDLIRGDVELHLLASGWFAHGHHRDPAYRSVVLHAVAVNDSGAHHTLHHGRQIPLLVLPSGTSTVHPLPFTPPCALETVRGLDPAPVLQRLGHRRLRARAAAIEPLVRERGPSGALYTAMLRVLGGPNAVAFAAAASSLPLAPLLQWSGDSAAGRAIAIRAMLNSALGHTALGQHRGRPASAPVRRIELAARILGTLWPGPARWPFARPDDVFRTFHGAGASRALAAELSVNAALPVSLAARIWPEDAVLAAWDAVPSPGTYGRLKLLEGWLRGGAATRPFRTAAALQGGLALHADYCTKGFCGRCPLSAVRLPHP